MMDEMIDWIAQHAGVLGLLFFFTFFTVMALWVYRPGARSSYQKHASIPLKGEQ